ncbi:MAG TPA: Trp family transcriptional regulator [Candidatus Nanoarchaeia archaeon]
MTNTNIIIILVIMTRVSKTPLKKSVWNQVNETFAQVLASSNQAQIEDFLQRFLTKEEKGMLAKRLGLYLMIVGGYSETEVKEALKVSYETFRQAKNYLDSSDEFSKFLSKTAKFSNKDKTSKLLRFVETALKAKTNTQARAKLSSGNF